MPSAIGASMYSPACSAKMKATRPIRISESLGAVRQEQLEFDFGGSRTIGAFFGVRFDIGIFRLDSTPETPFHAARFRRTEPRRVSGV